MTEHAAFIACPKGVETLLADELAALGGFRVLKHRTGGLYGRAALETLYRICLWSRLANRVLLELDRRPVTDRAALRDWLLAIDWPAHMTADQSLHIRFFGALPDIQHTRYGAQFVKDAICDCFRERTGRRPAVDRDRPDLRFQVNIESRESALYLDLSGESLHRRGYRTGLTAAPLKENLAAALLIRARWPDIAAAGGPLIDPLCGSATLLTEAALMAGDIAPGLLREHFGFSQWRQHEADLWQSLVGEARARRDAGQCPPILGFDDDPRALGVARQHIGRLNLGEHAPRVERRPLSAWRRPPDLPAVPGLLISNPPYGERLAGADLEALYALMGRQWVNECPDWHAAFITADARLAKATRLYWSRRYKFFNGALECNLYIAELTRGLKDRLPTADEAADRVDVQPFVQRLHKNRKRLAGWLKQQAIECYRLYYADIPEFNAAVDIYGDWALVQEYRPPASVDAEKAEQRLNAMLRALPGALELPAERIVLKQRRRQKGKAQYEKHDDTPKPLQVREGAARLWVDLGPYLDTGLFLDHRPVRLKLARLCHDKTFLNLFCYTGAATVHAALGGARRSVSVDMSNTYLDWARRNFELNALDTARHERVRADVLEWLDAETGRFDVIFLDPPTFSNSKRMDDTLDIQRDHAGLIDAAMRRLADDGVLIFSTNFRRFRLDETVTGRYRVDDVTDWSIPRDFQRPGKIHHCFEIRPRPG